MGTSCVYAPKKGKQTFYKFQKEFDYNTAWKIYGIAVNSKFKNAFKNSLSFDAEGVPTFDSLLHNDYIIRTLGNKIKSHLQRRFPIREDTIDNYYLMLEDAKKFNKDSGYNKYFTAIVGYDNEGNLTLQFQRKSIEADKKFSEQYAVAMLNRKLSNILQSLGVNIGLLSEIEQNSGRVGVTDFSIAKDIANDSISMIRVANNMEGARALSEEFSHLIIGALRNSPLMKRNLEKLSNEKTLKEILKDDYQDVYDFYDGDLDLMAEEALGQILQKELLNKELDGDIQGRLIKDIQNKFKNIKEESIAKAVTDAENSMSELATSIFSNTTGLSKKDIINSERNVQFNALSDRIKRNTALLKEAIEIESKRFKISNFNKDAKNYISDTIDNLEYSLRNKDTTLGVLKYANEALKALRYADKQLQELNMEDSQNKFKLLRSIRATIQAYGKFIDSLDKAAIKEDTEEDNDFLRDITFKDAEGNVKIVSVKEILKDLNSQYKTLTSRYSSIVVPAFAEFLKPILGNEITIEMGKNKGKKITIEELLTSSEGDISFMDRWLDSMGNSSDILLRAFDKVYKQAMDKSRLKSIKDFRRIQALRIEAESKGITTFDWMFERDRNGNFTGDYISEININQFKIDVANMEKSLSEKYGRNPKGENLKKKLEARREWYLKHTKASYTGERIPNDSYKNRDFQALTSDQKEIREKFLKLKEEFDSQYPEHRVDLLKAIQLRKNGVQRFIDSAKSPSSILSNIKEHLKEEFLDRTDDDAEFGDTRGGLTDFSGKEFMTLPVLFTNRLENPNELSTDIFGSLMAYTAASNNYSALDKIIDPLEIGRTIVTDYREVKSTRGNLGLVEKFNVLGRQFQKDIILGKGTNIEKRLDDFFESQIYHRYLKDSGVFEILNTKINKNKLVSMILKGSSIAQIGFNYLTNLSNVLTGVCMQNIEAASRQYFNAKELAKADKIYASLVGGSIAELNSRTKTNKLSLFNELFNIRSDFDNITHNSMRKSILARIFNSEIAYLGQSAGDHWLYLRTAIAMALREQVTVPNKGTMSLWDALQIKNTFDGNDAIKEMILPEGTKDSEGNPFDIGKFSRKIAHVNQNLFGIYNTDDRDAAQRVIVGRMVTQYRRWIKPQFNYRFQKAQYNLDTGTIEEGYWRTSSRIAMGLLRGQYQLDTVWDELKPEEKANIRKTLVELIQLAVVSLIVNLVKWPDDKNRPWAIKLAEYSSRRLQHELGTLVPFPSLIMLDEFMKTVKSPAASITQIQNLVSLAESTVDPTDWVDEIKSGKYKGMSTFEKNLLKSGLPGFAQYQQLNRLIYDIDNAMNYYTRK